MDSRAELTSKKHNVFYVNEEFFKKWSVDMAYVLGFFAADGCLTENKIRGNKYIEFVSTDYEIIDKIKRTLKSEHKISIKSGNPRWKKAHRLQIGSKKIF